MLRTNAIVVHLFNLIVTLKWFGLLDDIWDKIAGIASDIKYLTGHRLDTSFLLLQRADETQPGRKSCPRLQFLAFNLDSIMSLSR